MTHEELIAENERLTNLVERLCKVNDDLIAAAETQQALLEKKISGLKDVSRLTGILVAAGSLLGAAVTWLVMRLA